MDKSLIALILILPSLALAQTHTMPGSNVVPSGATLTLQSGSTTDFNAGATVDFTGATVTGLAGGGAVTSVFTRTGAVVAAVGDYSAFYQPLDTDLTTIAGLTATTNNFIGGASSAWASLTPTQVKTALGLTIGTNVQAWDTDLDVWATKTPYAGSVVVVTGKTFTSSNTLTLAGTDGSTLNIGAGGTLGTAAYTASTAYQAADTDLTTWAGITPTTVGQSFVTLTNPGAITFPKISATNVVSAESAATHLTSIGGTTVGQSFFTLANPGAITFPEISATNVVSTKTAAQLKTDLSLTATDVGLGNVTNNAQTQSAIVPNTAPSAGQILIGNAGNTAYAKQTLSGSGATATLSSAGVLALSAIPESSLSITDVTTGNATTSAHGFAPKGTVGTTQFWRQDWTLATPAGGGTTFIGLTDVPASYSGAGSKVVAVNAGATALEFITAPAAGAGGSTTQIQYNSTGTLAGDADFAWDATGNMLTMTGQQTVNFVNTDYTNTAGAGAHILLKNTDASGQNALINYINGAVRSKWRTDSTGNVNWIATLNHQFFTGGDYSVGIERLAITHVGPYVVLANNVNLGWTSVDGTTGLSSSEDIGFGRNTAGVVEINNGTAGQYRDLKCDEVDAVTGYKLNGTTINLDYSNTSVTNQTPSTSDVYLAGSNIVIPAGGFKANGQYRCLFDVVKSAGTGAIVLTVRIGTAGTTSDTSRMTFTFGSGTSVADTGTMEVIVNWRTVGGGTSAVISGLCRAQHNLATTGLFNNAAMWTIVGTVSGGFDSSAATTIGLSFNGATAFAGTITSVQSNLFQK